MISLVFLQVEVLSVAVLTVLWVLRVEGWSLAV